jgi:hypothetical protein
VRFLECTARRDDAEWCDREGRSSAFRRKVRPRNGMRAPMNVNAVVASPILPDPRFAGSPRETLWGDPIPRSCNAALFPKNCAMHPVANVPTKMKVSNGVKSYYGS